MHFSIQLLGQMWHDENMYVCFVLVHFGSSFQPFNVALFSDVKVLKLFWFLMSLTHVCFSCTVRCYKMKETMYVSILQVLILSGLASL